MNRFTPDHPGGGGVGFAIQCYCTAEVQCTSSALEIDYSREPIIRNFVAVFKNTTGYRGDFGYGQPTASTSMWVSDPRVPS